MADGFIYVLKNPHMPSLVKIGYTERSPDVRAIELSNHTGVPGSFSVVKSWLIHDAAAYESRIFSALAAHRVAGEHFQLSPAEAIERINIMLRTWGQIGDDGLTDAERTKVAEVARRAAEIRAKREEEASREARVKMIEGEIEDARCQAIRQAHEWCAPWRNTFLIGLFFPVIAASIGCFFVLYLNEPLGAWLFVLLPIAFPAMLIGHFADAKEKRLTNTLCETARKRILAKHGLPATWTPPLT